MSGGSVVMRRWVHLLLGALALVAPWPAPAQDSVERAEAEPTTAAESDGGAAAAVDGGPRAAAARSARALLASSIESQDSYARWFALRAARTLPRQNFAPQARKVARSGDRYDQSLALDILLGADPAGSRGSSSSPSILRSARSGCVGSRAWRSFATRRWPTASP
jgi:hypothetical protein